MFGDLLGILRVKKAPAPAIWMEPIGAPLVSSKVDETETKLICNTHAISTHVGGGRFMELSSIPCDLRCSSFAMLSLAHD